MNSFKDLKEWAIILRDNFIQMLGATYNGTERQAAKNFFLICIIVFILWLGVKIS